MRPILLLCLLFPIVATAQSPSDTYDVLTPVQTQLDAYNAGDLDLFLSAYSDSVRIYNFPDQLRAAGKEAMRETYGPMFNNLPDLHCRLVGRQVMGKTVIDHESVIFDQAKPPTEVIAIYRVEDGLITEVRFLRE